MITVDTLRKCSWLDSITLETLIRKNYPEDHVLTSEFVGITNGGQFCYNIGYQDADLDGQGYFWIPFDYLEQELTDAWIFDILVKNS